MNMNCKVVVPVMFMVMWMSGCTTVTPQFCNAENWHEIGYTDAMTGTSDHATPEPNSCASDDAPISYRLGFDYGLNKVCTFKKGLFTGEHGKPPARMCSDDKWDEYQNGYLMGHRIHLTNSMLEDLSARIEAYRRQLWQLESAPNASQFQTDIQALKAIISSLIGERDSESRRLLGMRADTIIG